jgi:hypothetical protein
MRAPVGAGGAKENVVADRLVPPVPPQWVVQVLTLEYVIDGYADEGGAAGLLLRPMTYRPPDLAVWLAPARLQPVGSLAVPVQEVSGCAIPVYSALVAIIPRDAASTAYLLREMQGLTLYAIPAALYVGPYVIRGTVLSEARTVADMAMGTIFVVQDAEIDCLMPGAQLRGLRVPHAVVHSLLVHALVPLQ